MLNLIVGFQLKANTPNSRTLSKNVSMDLSQTEAWFSCAADLPATGTACDAVLI